ncbi:MAG: YbjN domain-containing protein [Microcoleaceae cyanobacterium]
METPTIQSYRYCQNLTLHTPDGQAITLYIDKITLSIQAQEYIECRMIGSLSREVYAIVEAKALFHLNPEVRSQSTPEAFTPDQNIEVEISLSPHLLPHLTGYMHSQQGHLAAIEYIGDVLTQLSQNTPDDALLLTENWYAIAVRQEKPLPPELGGGSVKQGYTTQWATDPPQDETQTVLSSSSDQIYPLMMTFFTQEGIPFQEMDNHLILRIPINGENGFWDCFVEAREEDRQCLIYSVYRERVPQFKRLAMAEFITRANYGLPMGCFEMEFDEGEVRLRTSINLESERFSFGLLRPLFYANNAIMDRYFKGLTLVLNGKAIAKEAITMIEDEI